MRLFFAVDFTELVKDAIRRAIHDIAIDRPPWRWVAASNLHMTLKFLGDTEASQVAELEDCADLVCRDCSPFSIRLGPLGGFPNLKRPRVLFYRIDDGADPLIDLARRLDRTLSERLGIARDKRPFRAHATVARIKVNVAPEIIRILEAVPPLDGVKQPVQNLALIRSELHREGAKYHHLKQFALTKSK